MNEKNCNSAYRTHTCTSHYYAYMLGTYLTDGAIDVGRTENCFWFYDIIVSAQVRCKVEFEEFQVWYLKRINDDEFIVFGTNGNWVENPEEYGMTKEENEENILYKQSIPYSDFKFDTFKVFVYNVDELVIYLPSEH